MLHLSKEKNQRAIQLMPSGKTPALDRFPLKCINSLDWIILSSVFNSLQEEDKEGGGNAATADNVHNPPSNWSYLTITVLYGNLRNGKESAVNVPELEWRHVYTTTKGHSITMSTIT